MGDHTTPLHSTPLDTSCTQTHLYERTRNHRRAVLTVVAAVAHSREPLVRPPPPPATNATTIASDNSTGGSGGGDGRAGTWRAARALPAATAANRGNRHCHNHLRTVMVLSALAEVRLVLECETLRVLM